ncbi:Fur family transcriptional regulator [uncultured Megasphaera sp.]|uniref:Fur family transcriptional regulator n=1 Tax=uncultured Megasphaera sp. TaxID=165188 RepID=UPI0025EA1511|nr:Fur family transcriptional regulator [uncultured Megasphaera sp.]
MSDSYKDCLRRYGLKSTKARNGVLAILSRQESVVTVEAVYTELLEGGDKVSFSTVYRILEMFTKRALTEKVFLPDEGKYGFSLRRPGHTHRLICLQCHKIVDLSHCPLHDYERDVAKQTNFDIVSHNLELYGYCPTCKKKLPPPER